MTTPPDLDTQRIEEAAAILQQSSAVVKPTRSGFTTSAVLAARKIGQRITVITPTRRIGDETVRNANPQAVSVPGNAVCLWLRDEIQKEPLLAELPLPLPDCAKCRAEEWCEVRAILHANPRGTEPFYLTYAKVEALVLSSTESARKARRMLATSQILLLDEAHHLAFPNMPRVQAFREVQIPTGFRALARVMTLWRDLCTKNAELIRGLKGQGDAGHVGRHLARHAFIDSPLRWRSAAKAYAQLIHLAKTRSAHGMTRDDILTLRDIITILSGSLCYIVYNREGDAEEGRILIVANHGRRQRMISEFLHRMGRARCIFASGTLVEPHPGFFSELCGREVRQVIFQADSRIDRKMLIVPDRWRLGVKNFKRKLPVIVERVREILDEVGGEAYIIAPNLRMARVIQGEFRQSGTEVNIDYYRSDQTIGVARPERACIAIGTAQVPSNSYDHLAWGRDPETRMIESQKLRKQSVHCATWQAWSRVKDPKGEVESVVYCIGVPLEEVREVTLWGTGRRLELREMREHDTPDGPVRTPVFSVTVDRELCCARIRAEEKHKHNIERRTTGDFIAGVVNYSDKFINSYFLPVLPNNIYRQNGYKLGIYNNPTNENELIVTSAAIGLLFVHRADAYAQQARVNSRWGFVKVARPVDLDLIRRHVEGEITIGVYQIAIDDTVKWVCFDVDNHDGTRNARADCEKIMAVLRRYAVPFLLEASGSPDSYHVWVFLEPTKTLNAFKFSRQVASEAGVECEVWPKQKALTKNSKYGNLVKLPICFHNRSGSRSVFLDPGTFEPIEGLIDLPGLVRLFEFSNRAPIPGSGSEVRAKTLAPGGAGAKAGAAGGLDYCMERALADHVQLNGAEGHHLRLAIAVKAQAGNQTAEDTARLFQHQADYDYDYSLKKVLETWSYCYSPWSCETLREKCGTLVKRYCPTCPRHLQSQSSAMEALEVEA